MYLRVWTKETRSDSSQVMIWRFLWFKTFPRQQARTFFSYLDSKWRAKIFYFFAIIVQSRCQKKQKRPLQSRNITIVIWRILAIEQQIKVHRNWKQSFVSLGARTFIWLEKTTRDQISIIRCIHEKCIWLYRILSFNSTLNYFYSCCILYLNFNLNDCHYVAFQLLQRLQIVFTSEQVNFFKC